MGRITIYFLLFGAVSFGQSDLALSFPQLPNKALVSIHDLRLTPKAAKELSGANQLIAREDWTHALAKLRKLIETAPDSASAYNSLGIVYSHLGKWDEAREALERTIRLDDRFAYAYINLARLGIRESNWKEAEALLTKASALSPLDMLALSPLSYAQLKSQHFDEVLATCRQAHEAHVADHAFVHLIAALAYEQKQRPADMITQFRLYLREEPSGATADKVRKVLAKLNRPAAEAADSEAVNP